MSLDDLRRSADWSGFCFDRGYEVFMFSKSLTRRQCEHLGLKYPAVEKGIYRCADAILPDEFHSDARIAARAIDAVISMEVAE
ncbi:hypothetical protein FY036_06510 [Mesorhizobium microcysteis]|uniref:Uncharacterized protein n=1 Tax=Neoaquamicrobium microcysteis TaxID=2682781 RepID=A0A5D4GZV0_9HYPH|nr:hypothetical protein [Mesorhizobium microcysteis]TYR33704.1 hypothetical protein FY036_06510 [Mesorhizobium microcysteis]